MNRFLKITKQNVSRNFIGNLDVFNEIADHIDSNQTFCVCGPPGVGKTYMVEMLLNDKEWVDCMALDSYCHVVIDGISIDKNILEDVKKFGKLSKLSTILITQDSSIIDFCPIVEVPKAEVSDMLKIAKKGAQFLNLAILCDGNIRNFLNALEFNAVPDNFAKPKEIVKGLLSDPSSDPWSILSTGVTDHGYMWSIMHENSLLSPNWDCRISDSMSLADVYDGLLFSGNWDFMSYFMLDAFIVPSLQIDNSIQSSSIKPGSSWTKYNNQKMRIKKVKNMRLDIDRIHTIKELCRVKSENHMDVLKYYNVTRQDVDIINHLALMNKIKPRELTSLKKKVVDNK
tara:strand:- start:322 stop:1347 length:1026 start_codon:yes stop_codon:yes gene_type:complete